MNISAFVEFKGPSLIKGKRHFRLLLMEVGKKTAPVFGRPGGPPVGYKYLEYSCTRAMDDSSPKFQQANLNAQRFDEVVITSVEGQSPSGKVFHRVALKLAMISGYSEGKYSSGYSPEESFTLTAQDVEISYK